MMERFKWFKKRTNVPEGIEGKSDARVSHPAILKGGPSDYLRAKQFYEKDAEEEALQILDSMLGLPADKDLAIAHLKELVANQEMFKPSARIAGQDEKSLVVQISMDLGGSFLLHILILRGQCFSGLLDGKRGPELLARACENADIMSNLFPESVECLTIAAQSYIAKGHVEGSLDVLEMARRLLEKAESLAPHDQALVGTKSILDQISQEVRRKREPSMSSSDPKGLTAKKALFEGIRLYQQAVQEQSRGANVKAAYDIMVEADSKVKDSLQSEETVEGWALLCVINCSFASIWKAMETPDDYLQSKHNAGQCLERARKMNCNHPDVENAEKVFEHVCG